MPKRDIVQPSQSSPPDSITSLRGAHAVIVGVNRYADPRIRDLSYARADAEELAAILCDPGLGGFLEENVTLLVDEDATWSDLGSVCFAGQGVCRAAGVRTCNASDPAGATVCSAVAGTPGTEVCDGLDNDCNGSIPPNEADADGDGYRICGGDCNDSKASINPGATEVCNGVDDNCNGQVDENLSGATYTGNVAFTTQAQLNAWPACYGTIQGNVTIVGAGINNLGPLSNITNITGNLIIQSTSITSMNGLGGLTTVGGSMTIYFNGQLTTLNGLGNLATVGGNFNMYYNFKLSDCCAVYDLINGGVSGAIVIFFNKVGCNSVAQINANCAPAPPLVAGPTGHTTDANEITLEKNTGKVGQYIVDLYPNPVSTILTIDVHGEDMQGVIQLTDITGRIIWVQELASRQNQYRLDVSDIHNGLYFVTVKTTDKEPVVKRVVIE